MKWRALTLRVWKVSWLVLKGFLLSQVFFCCWLSYQKPFCRLHWVCYNSDLLRLLGLEVFLGKLFLLWNPSTDFWESFFFFYLNFFFAFAWYWKKEKNAYLSIYHCPCFWIGDTVGYCWESHSSAVTLWLKIIKQVLICKIHFTNSFEKDR